MTRQPAVEHSTPTICGRLVSRCSGLGSSTRTTSWPSHSGQCTVIRLGALLDQAKVKPNARFVVYHCFDAEGQTLSGPEAYYESSDLIDAYHPQTILAYGLNNGVLPVANGAPVRVRIERPSYGQTCTYEGA